MAKRWFITGTDTDVGKTVASCALLQAARRAGFTTAGYKPVASGSTMTSEGIRNADALALLRHSSVALRYEQVNPLAFLEPTSPHIACVREGKHIALERLSAGLQEIETLANWVQIEGAGGWYTPLSDTTLFADWVVREQLPVILVVGIKLGCINHALLTAQAVCAAGLSLVGWIACDVQPPGLHHASYLATLAARLPAPMLGEIPHLANAGAAQDTGRWLSVDALASR